MSPTDKPLAWLSAEIKTPPFSFAARLQAGYLLRRLQKGEYLSLPESRPMPSIGPRVHELRITDVGVRVDWRIVYRIDTLWILLVDVFRKTTRATPHAVIERCRARLRAYDET